MRIVAGDAGKCAAVAETSGTMQIGRLVADVPGIRPVTVIVQVACLAVAGAAKRIDLDGREAFGILYRPRAGRFCVLPAWAILRPCGAQHGR